jgi:hypothetical protein
LEFGVPPGEPLPLNSYYLLCKKGLKKGEESMKKETPSERKKNKKRGLKTFITQVMFEEK